MKKQLLLGCALFLLCSHDMYLKPDPYFLEANTPATIDLFNGTFEKSENVIARSRMVDASLVGNGSRMALDSTMWRDRDSSTVLDFTTGAAGTWVAGVSTRARNIELSAADFNDYLEHDGVLDMLQWRRDNDALGQDAVEKYSKHVKTIFQVGDQVSDDWKTVLGYPIEFVPLENPYELHPGHTLEVQLLWQGEPLANQLVYVGAPAGHLHEEADHAHGEKGDHTHDNDATHAHGDSEDHMHDHEGNQAHTHEADHQHDEAGDHMHDHEGSQSHTHEADHQHDHEGDHAHESESDHTHGEGMAEGHRHVLSEPLRTDSDGKVRVSLPAEGAYYLRTIHMTRSEAPGLTHESNWATLTFAIGEGHSHSHGTEPHSHVEEGGIPSYVYWIGSLLLLAVLFFWFKRKG